LATYCRNADTLAKLQAAEKALKEQQESAYVDMANSNEEKEAGNAAFKEQK
jgi:stress-induced-phosphoprotein 1